MINRVITPSKVTAWLDCPHYLTLRNQADDGLLPDPGQLFGSFARLLVEKGLTHESACLADYQRQGKSTLEVPARRAGEDFTEWVTRVGNPLNGDHDVVYQMPFIHDGIRGIADFLERVADPDTGAVYYEPVDAKLARQQAKPGHVLQLCFYAEAIAALTGVPPQRMHLWLGSGRRETLRVDDFSPYWRRLHGQLAVALAAGPAGGTIPEPCPHCEFCEFSAVCEQQWRDEDSLIYLPGIRRPERAALMDAGVATLATLAGLEVPCVGVRPPRLAKLVQQACLQVQARLQPEDPPPFSVIVAGEDPLWGHGFEQLPEPNDGDVFVDFEGHPFWRADAGLFFLFGLLQREADGQWSYQAWWAHDPAEEAVAVAELIGYLDARRQMYPQMHVYHYNHTERSSLERLTAVHGVAEAQLGRLVDEGMFVDLLVVARNAVQVGVESYGLKHLERLTPFERGHEIDQGAGAVVEYEVFMAEGDPESLKRIAAYNEDDVRATVALRDWLITQRDTEIAWREAIFEPDPGEPELDEQVARLHEFPPHTAEYQLGDVLGYWAREWRAYVAPKLATLQADPEDVFDNPDAVAGLQPVGLFPRDGAKGQPILPVMRFSFPLQDLDGFPQVGGTALFLTPEGAKSYATIGCLDRTARQLDLVWNDEKQESRWLPTIVVAHDWVSTKVKSQALSQFAARLVDRDAPNPVTVSLLGRELPRFLDGDGPPGGVFTDDLPDMARWVTRLDHSYVAVQGPPGTGKTYRAAHLVHTLVTAGRRVGITAMSHAAISNLLNEVLDVFSQQGDLDRLKAIHKSDVPVAHPQIKPAKNNNDCARAEFNVVAGTTWLFSSESMRAAPVDVLLVDEAGQLSLADTLAGSCSAHNLILLGDPLQLAQVSQAVHPGGGGRSALEHVLGDDITLHNDRGVFLSTTWRMHRDVCRFISDEIYEGRLTSHPDCARQTTVAGTGLRWLRAAHQGNSTRSCEEAELIAAEIARLIGTEWTDKKGNQRPLTATDFMVVAPYNDQVHTIRDRLADDTRTRGVPVGTVDKFQGQQAAVVFFSMTTSSGDDMTRGAGFLFSRHRLNVAISRAQCLAYLVCTEELLDTRARTVADMRLIATLNAFVEHANGSG